jgi:predicted dehydrogenase
MIERTVKVGLIGAGGIGRAYLEALRDSTTVEVVAVADERPEVAQEVAETFGHQSYGSYLALLEDGDCEAVLVCTPPVTHAEITIECVQRGKAVLCEKPFALDVATAVGMVSQAEEHGVVLTMASKFRYVDDMIRAKRIIDSGILGEIMLFENTFTSRVDMTNRWNADPAISGGGVLIDNGTHSVDIIRYFLGPIGQVHAVEGKRAQALRVEDTAQMFIESIDGAMGTIDLSWSLNKDRSTYVEVHGTEGTIRVGWAESKFRQAGSPAWVQFGRGYQKLDALRRQVENFCAAVAGTEQLLITAEDAIASVEVVQAAYASMRRDHWHPVRSDLDTARTVSAVALQGA